MIQQYSMSYHDIRRRCTDCITTKSCEQHTVGIKVYCTDISNFSNWCEVWTWKWKPGPLELSSITWGLRGFQEVNTTSCTASINKSSGAGPSDAATSKARRNSDKRLLCDWLQQWRTTEERRMLKALVVLVLIHATVAHLRLNPGLIGKR